MCGCVDHGTKRLGDGTDVTALRTDERLAVRGVDRDGDLVRTVAFAAGDARPGCRTGPAVNFDLGTLGQQVSVTHVSTELAPVVLPVRQRLAQKASVGDGG